MDILMESKNSGSLFWASGVVLHVRRHRKNCTNKQISACNVFFSKVESLHNCVYHEKEQSSEALPKHVKQFLHCTTSGKYPLADI